MTPEDARLAIVIASRCVVTPDGCWLYNGQSKVRGHVGNSRQAGAAPYVYREVYRLTTGPLEPDLVVDHLCGNPGCCNPDHLDQTTNAVNTRRGSAAEVRRAAARQQSHCANGHEFTPTNTRRVRDYKNHRRCVICARAASARFRAKRATTEESI